MISMSMKINFDVDIDFADRDKALELLRYVDASIPREGGLEKHNTGVYLQDIPMNPKTHLSNIGHKQAQELGYVKLDCLNVGIYEGVRDEEHLVKLMVEPNWELLAIKEIVQELFHIGEYFDLVNLLKPRSIPQLAMVLAIIRPSKKHLSSRSWQEIEREIWVPPEDGAYYFKKSHATGYAMAIVVQLNLLTEQAR